MKKTLSFFSVQMFKIFWIERKGGKERSKMTAFFLIESRERKERRRMD